ncbi:MAG: lipocalin-like domain-containing protein [Pseudomonadota bacterium]
MLRTSPMTRRQSLGGIATLLAAPALGQGYAGLGTEAAEFAQVLPETRLSFPADHGPHPDFRIEWWYITANIVADDEPMGLQWTLFRQARAPSGRDEGWASRQTWMGHAAVTTRTSHHVAEAFARGGIGQAGVELPPFRAWLDDWRLESPDSNIDELTLSASGDRFSYTVTLKARGPLVLQGVDGYSVKSEQGQASHYYSQPHYGLDGTLTLDGVDRSVTGRAWLDREWSSQPLSEDQTGWDWFALHLDTGEKLMAYRLRGAGSLTTGAWIARDGTSRVLPPDEMQFTPLHVHRTAGRDVPVDWRLIWPEQSLEIDVRALNRDSYMPTVFPYWEGPVTFSGTHSGIGYLEMTGY